MTIRTIIETLTNHKLAPLNQKANASYMDLDNEKLYVCAIIGGQRIFRTYSLESNELINEFGGAKQLPLKYYQRLVNQFNTLHKTAYEKELDYINNRPDNN